MSRIALLFFLLLSSSVGIAQAGKLDVEFGEAGVVTGDFGTSFNYNTNANQVLTDSSGQIYVSITGPFGGTMISRQLPDGSIDSTYGANGFSRLVAALNTSAVLQTDDKLLVAGYQSPDGATITRMLTDGKIDSSFGTNGVSEIAYIPRGIDVQADGNIVVVGGGEEAFHVYRYTTSGLPDTSFNHTSEQQVSFEYTVYPDREGDPYIAYSGTANTVMIQPDGKILVGGAADLDNLGSSFAVCRFATDGSIDSTFGKFGKQTVSVSGNVSIGSSLDIQSDGKIVVGGFCESNLPDHQYAVVRMNATGIIDSTYNANGIVLIPMTADRRVQHVMKIDSNDCVTIGGYFQQSTNDITIVRLNIDGGFDSAFADNGILTTDLAAAEDFGRGLSIQEDGKLLITGFSRVANVENYKVLRYTSNGSLDPGFGEDGIFNGNFNQGQTRFNSSVLQNDGKLIVVGKTWNGNSDDFVVARYGPTGILDNTFNGTGFQVLDFGMMEEALSVFVTVTGKILVAGTSDDRSGIFNCAVVQLHTDGTIDSTYGTNGKTSFTTTTLVAGRAAAIQPDGKLIFIGGASNTLTYDDVKFWISRLDTNGHLDNTFGENGSQQIAFGGSFAEATCVAVKADGKILVGGRTYQGQDYFAMAVLDENGMIDTSFSKDGKITDKFGTDDYFAQTIAVKNGKIVLAGFAQTKDGSQSKFFAARYFETGLTDSSFNHVGYQSTDAGNAINMGMSVALTADSKIVLGGSNNHFTTVLYQQNGNLDSSFGSNGIVVSRLGQYQSLIRNILPNNNLFYAVGWAQSPGEVGVVARYILKPEGGPTANAFITIADGNWNDPQIWLGGLVPVSTADVFIKHQVNITAEASCRTLTIQPQATLTILAGQKLAISSQ